MLEFLAIAWVSLVIALVCRAVSQFLAYETVETRPWRTHCAAPRVTFVVPAANDLRTLGKCVCSLLAQDYPNFEIIVVDDGSSTSANRIAQRFERIDSRIRVVSALPAPDGWEARAHACWRGAVTAQGRWLCFVDASAVASRCLLSSVITLARMRKIDMLSLEPFHELGSFWERLIMPIALFLLAISHDHRHVNAPSYPDAAANGQFILIRRTVYLALRGHAAVHAAIGVNCALARLVKASGKSVALMRGESLIQTRLYAGLNPLWDGLSKSVIGLAGGFAETGFGAGLALLIAMASVVFPAMAVHACYVNSVVNTTDVAACEGSLASALLLATHIATARHFRIPWWYGLLFPFAYAAGTLIALNSIALRLRSRLRWKGRSLRPA